MGKRAALALEDGTIFYGESLGVEGETVGEVVFNTSMTGYQEILTDPSYAGQIVCLTYPHIGNYGINPEDMEARRSFVAGFIVIEPSGFYSNWRAKNSLEEFLLKEKIVGIKGIDTRALVRHIRLEGAMRGVISTLLLDEKILVKKAKDSPSIIGKDLVKKVTVRKPYLWKETQAKYRVAALDYGIKLNILRELAKMGCQIKVVPAKTSAKEILAENPDGIFLSNGPGDPEGVPYAIRTIGELLGKKPIFGICLGHQLLALALGGKTYKLKFGHRGANHPVKNFLTGKVEITTQNHGFAVDAASLQSGVKKRHYPLLTTHYQLDVGRVEITHINLNDGTVEGLRCLDMPAFSVQYHPEASPGPHDSKYLFGQFIELMKKTQMATDKKSAVIRD